MNIGERIAEKVRDVEMVQNCSLTTSDIAALINQEIEAAGLVSATPATSDLAPCPFCGRNPQWNEHAGTFNNLFALEKKI